MASRSTQLRSTCACATACGASSEIDLEVGTNEQGIARVEGRLAAKARLLAFAEHPEGRPESVDRTESHRKLPRPVRTHDSMTLIGSSAGSTTQPR